MKLICTAILAICIELGGIRVFASDLLLPVEDAVRKTERPYFVPACTPEQRAWSLLEIPSSAVPKFTGEPDKSVELKNYSITLDLKGKSIPAYASDSSDSSRPRGTRCGYRSPKRSSSYTSYFPVTRPGEANFVAVIKAVSDGGCVLNPIRGFDYGPIPLLTCMTLEQADVLWGKAIKDEVASETWRTKTYQLDSTNVNGISKTFLLACSFKNGRIMSYEISGRAINGGHGRGLMDERSRDSIAQY